MNVSLSPSGNTCSIYVTGITGNKSIRITATNSCGSSTTDVVIYIPSSMRVYPNPATTQLTVEFSSTEYEEALPDQLDLVSEKDVKTVKALKMKDVYNAKKFTDGNKVEFDIHDLARGTYYLRVSNSRESADKKSEMIRLLFQ